ncbi:UNVERIFIED_CONTAM: two-component system, sporulation sensor kinase E [Brevibacillus sp. OAP136]
MQIAMKKWTERRNSTEKSSDSRKLISLEQAGSGDDQWDKPVNILLVDDRPENLLSLEAVLDSPDYRLVSVQTGQEALRWVLKEEFALILLDVQMPGLNGFETAKLIKQRERSRHIPIIFVTAISKANEHVEQGYAAGAIDYIFKPFHSNTLKMKVEQFVQLYRKKREIEHQRQMLHLSTLELQNANYRYQQAMLELQKSEALSRTIVETSADTILTLDEKGAILSSNPVVEPMFGYSLQEVLHEPIGKLLVLEGDIAEGLQEGMIEACGIRKDQTSFPIDLQVGKATVHQQHIFVCSIRDITERKQFEAERRCYYQELERLVSERTQELRLSQELFQKNFQASPCLIAIRSCVDGRYIDVNQSWLDYTGYTYEEVKNCASDRIIQAPSLKQRYADKAIDLYDAFRNVNIHFLTKAGEVRDGLLSTESINVHGESCVLSVITDITERVYLEKEMARLDRLHLIGEMAAGIAHEIRNPMTTVRGFLQLGKKQDGGAVKPFLDIMITELDRANTIITEFLTLAKNKTNDLQRKNLFQVIDPLLPLVQAEASLAGKNMQTMLDECPPVDLDEKEMCQLFLNLALNGLEAMEADGTLTIKMYPKDNAVVLEIIDEGPGIQEELLEKIWTPFFTTKEQGTGLGLAVCYSIANRHHAKIEVSSSSKGSVFSVRLPIPQDE